MCIQYTKMGIWDQEFEEIKGANGACLDMLGYDICLDSHSQSCSAIAIPSYSNNPYSTKPNLKYTTRTQTFQNCKDLCDNIINCRTFTYAKGQCYLKYKYMSNAVKQLTSLPCEESGTWEKKDGSFVKRTNCKRGVGCCDSIGNDIGNVYTVTLQKCKDSCNMAECKGFTYAEGKCYRKSIINTNLTPLACEKSGTWKYL